MYNPNALDLFIDGDASSHPPYFGAVRQFNKIEFDLHNFASTMDFTWQYFDNNDDWEVLGILSDGTNATGNTLSQSGIISFDFPFGPLGTTNDPDGSGGGGGDMPNVNKDMYWLRLYCDDPTPTSIPAISGYSASAPPVEMYRYVDLTVEMKSEINLVSKFDNRTYYQVGTTKDHTLGVTSFTEFAELQYNHDLYGTGDAIISFWPYSVNEYDALLLDDVPITQAINFRIATFDDVDHYLHVDYSSIGSTPANLTLFNYTSYDTYGYSGSFNESNYDGVVLSVDGEMYDWYQFICQSDNTADSVTATLLFDNVWTDNSGPVESNVYPLFDSNSNDSAEMGIAPSSFKLVFIAQADNVSENVDFRLNIASYGVQLLTPNLTLVESSIDTGVPSWVLPTSIGGGVLIIAVVGGVVVYKKKHPL